MGASCLEEISRDGPRGLAVLAVGSGGKCGLFFLCKSDRVRGRL